MYTCTHMYIQSQASFSGLTASHSVEEKMGLRSRRKTNFQVLKDLMVDTTNTHVHHANSNQNSLSVFQQQLKMDGIGSDSDDSSDSEKDEDDHDSNHFTVSEYEVPVPKLTLFNYRTLKVMGEREKDCIV